MRNLLIFIVIATLCGCIKAGEFSPERNAQYEYGNADCQKTPHRCINGVPW